MDDDRDISIECQMSGDGWRCSVGLAEAGRSHSYDVTVSNDELKRFAPGQFDPTMLVAQSFRFLLDREGPESIMSSFALSDIERYFPEYSFQIARLMRP